MVQTVHICLSETRPGHRIGFLLGKIPKPLIQGQLCLLVLGTFSFFNYITSALTKTILLNYWQTVFLIYKTLYHVIYKFHNVHSAKWIALKDYYGRQEKSLTQLAQRKLILLQLRYPGFECCHFIDESFLTTSDVLCMEPGPRDTMMSKMNIVPGHS